MNRLSVLALTLLAGVAGCADTPISCFQSGGGDSCGGGYGGNQPGEGLAEAVRSGTSTCGPATSANAPFPGAIAGSQYGNCVDERDPQTATWPFKPITGATYVDLPTGEQRRFDLVGGITNISRYAKQ